MQVSKRCSRCKRVKYLAEFHAHAKTIDRHQSHCKRCENERDNNLFNWGNRLSHVVLTPLVEPEWDREQDARNALADLTE